MKNTTFLLLSSILILLTSCENIEKKTVQLYCETIKKAVSDTTISYVSISKLQEKTYKELFLNNEKLKNNTDFINSLSENDNIKGTQKSIKTKIIGNAQNILKNNIFVSGLDNRWQMHKLIFDGIMVNIISIQIDLRGSYESENIRKKYTLILEENGNVYVNTKNDEDEDLILELGKNKTEYLLALNDRLYFSVIEKN
jgi:hypothetical protein